MLVSRVSELCINILRITDPDPQCHELGSNTDQGPQHWREYCTIWFRIISKPIWKKGTIQVIVLNIFHSNSDLNIFDNSSEYIINNLYPNILEKKYE